MLRSAVDVQVKIFVSFTSLETYVIWPDFKIVLQNDFKNHFLSSLIFIQVTSLRKGRGVELIGKIFDSKSTARTTTPPQSYSNRIDFLLKLNLLIDLTPSPLWRLVTWMHDTCNIESSQSEEGRAQPADSSKACSKPRVLAIIFNCNSLAFSERFYLSEAVCFCNKTTFKKQIRQLGAYECLHVMIFNWLEPSQSFQRIYNVRLWKTWNDFQV